MIVRFLRWLGVRASAPRRPVICPHCGEDRLVERARSGRGFCAVCGRTWVDPPDDPDDADRRHWRRVLGGR
jgi:ribosomal protein L37AE/L43A